MRLYESAAHAGWLSQLRDSRLNLRLNQTLFIIIIIAVNGSASKKPIMQLDNNAEVYTFCNHMSLVWILCCIFLAAWMDF